MGFQLPGYEQGRTFTPREIFADSKGQLFLPGGIVLDSAKALDGGNTYDYELLAGWALGKITASKKYRLCTCTKVNGTSGAVTSAVVDNARPFRTGDAITIGGDAVTLTNVVYGTNTLSWSGAITIADNDVVLGTDGSQILAGFLPHFTKMKNIDNTVAIDKSAQLVIGGSLLKDYLLGDIDAIREQAANAVFLYSFRFIKDGQLV
jgi:hypothetical protein